MNFWNDWDNKRGHEGAQQPGQAFTSVETSAYGRQALDEELERLRLAHQGERNNTLNVVAFSVFQLVEAGHVNEREAYEQLDSVAQSKGLTRSEIAKTMASARGAASRKQRSNVPDPQAPIDDKGASLVWTPSQPVTPAEGDFWGQRPYLAHIRDFARARRCSPWAVLGISLARLAATVPSNVVLPPIIGGRASLNTFVALVGRSGDGKDAAMACAEDAFDFGDEITVIGAGSGEGIPHLFAYRDKKTGDVRRRDNASVILTAAEVDTLGALMRRQSSTLLPELRKAWTGSALGFAYADQTKHLPVRAHSYRLGLIVGVQPERASILLDDADAGTPQRFVWLDVIDADAPDIAPDEPKTQTPMRPLYGQFLNGGFIELEVCQQAIDVITQARLERLRGKAEVLDGHLLLCQLKIAALLGLLEGRAKVQDDDWLMAGAIINVSQSVRDRTQQTVKRKFDEQNKQRGEQEAQRNVIVEERKDVAAIERARRSIMRRLVDHGPEVAASKLRRDALAGKDRVYFDKAVSDLMDAGKVTVREEGKSRWYRLA